MREIVGLKQSKGWGLIATQTIKQKTVIGEYMGEILCDNAIKERYVDVNGIWIESTYLYAFSSFAEMGNDYAVDAKNKRNNMAYLNHSCDANCEFYEVTF